MGVGGSDLEMFRTRPQNNSWLGFEALDLLAPVWRFTPTYLPNPAHKIKIDKVSIITKIFLTKSIDYGPIS